MNATLVLVRHGQSTWVAEGRFQGRGDPPLSELGRAQAASVADRLARAEGSGRAPVPAGAPVAVWHSPLQRAADTASAIAGAQAPPSPLKSAEDLSELDQGQWQGLTHAEVRTRWPQELDAWRRDPTTAYAPGGEHLPDAARRVATALGTITAAFTRPDSDRVDSADRSGSAHPWGIVVAHDGVLRLALMGLLGVPLERFWSFPFALCAVSLVELQDGRATLQAHNLADHLQALHQDEPALTDRGGAL